MLRQVDFVAVKQEKRKSCSMCGCNIGINLVSDQSTIKLVWWYECVPSSPVDWIGYYKVNFAFNIAQNIKLPYKSIRLQFLSKAKNLIVFLRCESHSVSLLLLLVIPNSCPDHHHVCYVLEMGKVGWRESGLVLGISIAESQFLLSGRNV